VVIVLIDDIGFGIHSAFGGCMDMPTTDRLAETGLRYNQFHLLRTTSTSPALSVL
jgi:arylsulfatase